MNIRILFTFLFLSFGLNSGAQESVTNESTKGKNAQLAALVEEYAAATLHEYSKTPMYYLQVKKSDCRIMVRINDIPVYDDFSFDEVESGLYPINSALLGSGQHTVCIEILPSSLQENLTEDIRANARILFLSDVNASETEAEVIKELDLSESIGTQKLKNHKLSATFDVSVPFNYSDRLAKARDLRQISNLEELVVKRYNEIRQYLINFDQVGYQKRYFKFAIPSIDMLYLKKEDVLELVCSQEGFNRQVLDRKVEPIIDYEMQVCGNGKLVRLQRKFDKSAVLQVNCRQKQNQITEIDEDGIVRITFEDADENADEEFPVQIIMDFLLYMPEGSDQLEIYG